MIKPNMIITTADGPFYAINHRRTVRTIRKSDVVGAWVCKDFITGEDLIVQESKLLHSLNEFKQPDQPSTENPS